MQSNIKKLKDSSKEKSSVMAIKVDSKIYED